MNTCVFTFGRFSPPTLGHEKLVKRMMLIARQRDADIRIFLTKSFDLDRNPIPYKDKVKLVQQAFGDLVVDWEGRTFFDVLKALDGNYDNVVMVVGEDRIPEFKRMLTNYNGREFNFQSTEVISAGDRDPNAQGIEGVSGTKIRQFVRDGDFESFRKNLATKLRPRASKIFNNMSDYLNIKESKNISNVEETNTTMKTFVQKLKEDLASRSKPLVAEDQYATRLRDDLPDEDMETGYDPTAETGPDFSDPEQLAGAAEGNVHLDRAKKMGDYYFNLSKQQLKPDKAEDYLKIARKYYDVAKYIANSSISDFSESKKADKDFLAGKGVLSELSKHTLKSYYRKSFDDSNRLNKEAEADLDAGNKDEAKNKLLKSASRTRMRGKLLKRLPEIAKETTERLAKEEKDPCWKGYKQVGMKKKGGKKVPNCVPESVEPLAERDEMNRKKKREFLAKMGKEKRNTTNKEKVTTADIRAGRKAMKEENLLEMGTPEDQQIMALQKQLQNLSNAAMAAKEKLLKAQQRRLERMKRGNPGNNSGSSLNAGGNELQGI